MGCNGILMCLSPLFIVFSVLISSRKSSWIAKKEKGDRQKDPAREKEDPVYWIHNEVRKLSSLINDNESMEVLH